MTKHVCDRCGEDVASGDLCHIAVKDETFYQDGDEHHFELCPNCTKALKQFFKTHPTLCQSTPTPHN